MTLISPTFRLVLFFSLFVAYVSTAGSIPAFVITSVKVIVEDDHHHHDKNKGHGSMQWQCLSNSLDTQACGYGCIKDQFDWTKIYCGAKPGDNCATDTFGKVKCGKNCVATQMSAIVCDKERYSKSSARP